MRIGQLRVDITADISQLRANLATASSLIRDWSILAEGFSTGFSNAFRQITDVGLKTFQVGLIAATAAIGGASYEGAQFEDAMVRTFTIIGKGAKIPEQAIEDLTDKARLLGRETLFSATDAAEGMQILAKAGNSVREVISSIEPVLNLAIAGNIEMEESAGFVIQALKSFDMQAWKAVKVSDVLAKAAASANTDVRLMGEALSYVGPVAHSAGWSLEETTAAIAVLSNAGIRGSRAGTTLRRALSQMLAPSGKAKAIMEKLGLSFSTADGKARDLRKVIDELDKAGVTTAQIFQMFGLRAGPGMAALLTQGSRELRKMESAMYTAHGTANKMAQAFRTTLKGRIRDLIASVKDLGIELFESFKKPMTDAVFWVRNLVVDIVKAVQSVDLFKNVMKGIRKVFGAFGLDTKKIKERVTEFIKTLTPTKVSEFFTFLAAKAKELAPGFKELFSAIGNMIRTIVEKGPELVTMFTELTKIVTGTATVLLDIFNILSKTGALNFINTLLKGFEALPTPIKKMSLGISGLVAGLLKLVGGLSPIVTMGILLATVFKGLGPAFTVGAIAPLGIALLLLKLILGVTLIIGAAIAGWGIGQWMADLEVMQNFLATIGTGWRIFWASAQEAFAHVRNFFVTNIVNPIRAFFAGLAKYIDIKIAPIELIDTAKLKQGVADAKKAFAEVKMGGIGARGIGFGKVPAAAAAVVAAPAGYIEIGGERINIRDMLSEMDRNAKSQNDLISEYNASFKQIIDKVRENTKMLESAVTKVKKPAVDDLKSKDLGSGLF